MEEKRKVLSCKLPIVLLTIIALIFKAFASVSYFIGYTWVSYKDEFTLTFVFPNFTELLSFLLNLTPVILFALYTLVFRHKLKASALVPITLALLAFTNLYYILESVISGYGIYDGIIWDLLAIAAFALATYCALTGFVKKPLYAVALGGGLLTNLLSFVPLLEIIRWYINDGNSFEVFTWFASFLGTTALYVALLLFGLNNKIPAYVTVSAPKNKQQTPEQALRLLKDKRELDIITEEEYQAKRAEIINNL